MPPSSRPPRPDSEASALLAQRRPSRPLFTCTFCWHLSPDPPRVLGRSARLACRSCFAGLIDLAICWVCGEVVFRGDDCVSLGWCFWHRGCYGCLLCGSRLICRGAAVEELFDGEGGDRGGVEMGRDKGREVDTVPLCANCLVEAEIDDLDEHAVQQKALKRMDHIDGGLGRMRWEKQKLDRLRLKMSPETGQPVCRPQQQQPIRVEQRRMDDTAPVDGHECVMPLDSTIYVSMSDPLGEPAFKPSPTKPIPRWMQYLPEYRETYRPEEAQSPSRSFAPALPGHAEPSEHRSRASSGMSAATICPSRAHTPVSTPPPLSPRTSSKSITSSPFQELADLTCPPLELRTTRQQPLSWVSHEPLKRPSSRIGFKQAHERSETETSAYLTPPEFSVDEGEGDVPLPQAGASRGRRRQQDPFHRPQSPLAEQAESSPSLNRSHHHDVTRPLMRTPPPLSSEYLDKYRPIRSPSPRPAAGFREPMAMIEAMRRESMATSSSASTAKEPETPSRTTSGRRLQETVQPSLVQDQVRAGRRRRRMSGVLEGLQAPLDGAESLHPAAHLRRSNSPGKRRNHLQSELKKLFGK